MTDTSVQTREITLADRCDACGAAAKVVATFLNGELLFCGHHARAQLEALKIKSVSLYDPDNECGLIH